MIKIIYLLTNKNIMRELKKEWGLSSYFISLFLKHGYHNSKNITNY